MKYNSNQMGLWRKKIYAFLIGYIPCPCEGASWVELSCSHPTECAPCSPKTWTGLPHVDPIAPTVIFDCIKGSDKVRFA